MSALKRRIETILKSSTSRRDQIQGLEALVRERETNARQIALVMGDFNQASPTGEQNAPTGGAQRKGNA